MRRIAAAALISILVLALAGCGGGSDGSAGQAGSDADAVSLLVESTKATSGASSYRMSGQIKMDTGDSASGTGSTTMSMDISSDVQNTGGDVRQHVIVSMSGYQMDAYIIDGVYYQNVPGQGWFKMSVEAYKAQNLNMNLMDADQLQLMADLAENIEVFDEGENEVGVSFQLGRKFLEASMNAFRDYMQQEGQQVPEEWQQIMDNPDLDFQADVRIWMDKESKLASRMDMDYKMVGMPDVGDVSSSMTVDIYDYNTAIDIQLPEEAKNAVEYSEMQ